MFAKQLKSEFFRNLLTLMTGTAIAQAIPILISPILSRLYTPEEFGVLALFMSAASVLGVISTARYELAIMLPDSKRDAMNVLMLSIGIAMVVSLASLVIILLFQQPILTFFNTPELEGWLFLVPVMVLLMGVYQSFNYWSTRNKTFKKNSAGRISQSVGMSAVNLSLGFAGAGSIGLVIGSFIGQAIAALVLAWRAITHPKEWKMAFSIKLIRKNANKYSNFPRINTPHAFIDTLQNHGIVLIIIYFFTKTILGSYNFAYRVLKAPVGLIGSSMYQVFYQKASRSLNEGTDIRPMVIRIYRNLFVIGFPVFTLLFIFAPEIFAFVFSEQYRMAGEIAQILMPWLFLNYMVMPVTCVAVVMNRQKGAFLISLTDIVFKAIALIVGGISGNYEFAFLLMSILCSALLLFAMFWYYRIASITFVKSY